MKLFYFLILPLIFLFSSVVFSHEESFRTSDDLTTKINNYLEKLNRFELEGKGLSKRPYYYIYKGSSYNFQPTAVAELILEGMEISVDSLEEHLKQSKDIPFSAKEHLKKSLEFLRNKIRFKTQESNNESQLQRGARNTNIVNHLATKFRIFVKSETIQIYNDRGTLAVSFIAATWLPYTVITEVLEHIVLNNYAFICNYLQFFYFAKINSLFSLTENMRLLLKHNSLNDWIAKKTILLRWIRYEREYRKMVKEIFIPESNQEFVKKDLKRDFKKIHQSLPDHLNFNRTLWADILVRIRSLDAPNVRMEFVSLQTQIRTAFSEESPIYRLAMIKELYTVYDILTTEFADLMKLYQREQKISLEDFYKLKGLLGSLKKQTRIERSQILIESLDDRVDALISADKVRDRFLSRAKTFESFFLDMQQILEKQSQIRSSTPQTLVVIPRESNSASEGFCRALFQN